MKDIGLADQPEAYNTSLALYFVRCLPPLGVKGGFRLHIHPLTSGFPQLSCRSSCSQLGYVLFEIPANIVLKKFSPRIWLPSLTIAWGVTATLQALIKNEAGFYAARFFMGVSEAGLFPGVIFVFSM